MPENQKVFWVGLILVGATLAVYWPACGNGFVNYDDELYVTRNQDVKEGLNRDAILWAFTTHHTSNWHPLTWLSLQLDADLYGDKPWGFHLTNVLLHAANTLLLFLALWRMTGAIGRCAFVAGLFAFHPLHVESVAWVSERKDVLSTFFWMLALLAYSGYGKKPSWKKYLFVSVSFALGLMAKPMLVTLPFVLLLLDYWPLRRFQGQPAGPNELRPHDKPRTLILEKFPLIALSLFFSIITVLAQHREIGTFQDFPLSIRLGNAVIAYAFYLEKTFWPVNLAVFYPHPGINIAVWQVIVAAAVLGLISLLVWKYRRPLPYLPVGWLWFLGTLIPVIGLVQVGQQALADRYTYIPLIGLFLMVAWGLGDLASRWQWEKWRIPAGATVLTSLAVVTFFQIQHWQDSETLWRHALEVADANATAHNNLGLALRKKGMIEEAISHYFAALEYEPKDPYIHNNLGMALLRQDEPGKALIVFQSALNVKPNLQAAQFYQGLAHAMKGKKTEAADWFKKSLGEDPNPIQIQQYFQALMSSDEGKIKAGYPVEPFWAEGFYVLGWFLSSKQKPEALEYYARAARIQPENWKYRLLLAAFLKKQGKDSEASEQIQETFKVDPGWPQKADKVAFDFLYKDPEQAIILAEQVCQAKCIGNHRIAKANG